VLPGPSTDRVLANPRRQAESAATPGHERASETPEPTLRFEPDPRPNADAVAPRRVVDEPVTFPLFTDPEVEAERGHGDSGGERP